MILKNKLDCGDDSLGRSTYCASMRTWVWILRSQVKSLAWPHTLVCSYWRCGPQWVPGAGWPAASPKNSELQVPTEIWRVRWRESDRAYLSCGCLTCTQVYHTHTHIWHIVVYIFIGGRVTWLLVSNAQWSQELAYSSPQKYHFFMLETLEIFSSSCFEIVN